MKRLAMIFAVLASGALAQAPMTGAEFDAYTTGKTLTYMKDGIAYGIEQYLGGRRVTWAFDNDDCLEGYWWEPEPALICFEYEDRSNGPQCWNFFKTDNGLRAVFVGDSDGLELYEARRSIAPLQCLGPEVGT